jgi:MFS family permease
MTSIHSPENRKSGLIGIASSLTVFGNMLGPLSGGMIAGYFGLSGVFIINSTMFIICSILVWMYYHDHEPKTGNA